MNRRIGANDFVGAASAAILVTLKKSSRLKPLPHKALLQKGLPTIR
ncbi:MAG: hypothetical protein ABIV12_05145 [Dokdonella sp.]